MERRSDPDGASGPGPVVSLESPHNSIHPAVGGFEIPSYDRSPIDGANGDMGENDTAALDPIYREAGCLRRVGDLRDLAAG